jgi:hypothetical protein
MLRLLSTSGELLRVGEARTAGLSVKWYFFGLQLGTGSSAGAVVQVHCCTPSNKKPSHRRAYLSKFA